MLAIFFFLLFLFKIRSIDWCACACVLSPTQLLSSRQNVECSPSHLRYKRQNVNIESLAVVFRVRYWTTVIVCLFLNIYSKFIFLLMSSWAGGDGLRCFFSSFFSYRHFWTRETTQLTSESMWIAWFRDVCRLNMDVQLHRIHSSQTAHKWWMP